MSSDRIVVVVLALLFFGGIILLVIKGRRNKGGDGHQASSHEADRGGIPSSFQQPEKGRRKSKN